MRRLNESAMLGVFQDLSDKLHDMINAIGSEIEITDDSVTDWIDIHKRADALLTDLDIMKFDAGQRDVIDPAMFRSI